MGKLGFYLFDFFFEGIGVVEMVIVSFWGLVVFLGFVGRGVIMLFFVVFRSVMV